MAQNAWFKTPAPRLSACGRFNELRLNAHVNIVADGRIPRRQTELRATEMTFGRKTQRVFFRERVGSKAVKGDVEHHWLRDATNREIARQCAARFTGALKMRADEANFRVALHVEHIAA